MFGAKKMFGAIFFFGANIVFGAKKKIGANRAPSPACVCSGNDDLAFSLLSLCLPAKTCRCKSGQAPGCISRIFFSPTICIVCRSTYYYYYYDYYCRTIISPFVFATVKNVRFG